MHGGIPFQYILMVQELLDEILGVQWIECGCPTHWPVRPLTLISAISAADGT
jgi:hypothetical protein